MLTGELEAEVNELEAPVNTGPKRIGRELYRARYGNLCKGSEA